jgi:uncharacterized membrane protein
VSREPDIEARSRAWVEAGLIDDAQATSIVAFEHQSRPPAGERVAGALGSLGALLVGLGVLLTVGANWDNVGDTTKLLTLLITMLVAYGLAVRADLRGAARWAGTAGYIVGTLVFASSVFLLGQVYNVHAHDPLGFLVVAVTASVIAVLVRREPIGWIAAAAWLAWAMHEFVLSIGDTDSTGAAMIIAGVAMLLALAAIAAGWVLDAIAARAVRAQDADTDRPLAADLDMLGAPFRVIAFAGMLMVLIPASFAYRFDDADVNAVSATPQLLIMLALALLGAGWVAHSSDLRTRRMVAIGIAISALFVVLGVLVQDATLAGVLANLLLAGGGIGLCGIGLVEDRRGEYAAGVAWIIALVGARYVDVMVELEFGGLGFVGAGILLLGCAWLVGRSRRIWQGRDAT